MPRLALAFEGWQGRPRNARGAEHQRRPKDALCERCPKGALSGAFKKGAGDPAMRLGLMNCTVYDMPDGRRVIARPE